MDKRTIEIIVKDKDGKDLRLWCDLGEWEYQRDWLDYREYLLFKYPIEMIYRNPGMRIPDREGEEDSFENWKANGKPKASLFNYGTLVPDEASKEFTDLIMKK